MPLGLASNEGLGITGGSTGVALVVDPSDDSRGRLNHDVVTLAAVATLKRWIGLGWLADERNCGCD